jgi:hypothetical protein
MSDSNVTPWPMSSMGDSMRRGGGRLHESRPNEPVAMTSCKARLNDGWLAYLVSIFFDRMQSKATPWVAVAGGTGRWRHRLAGQTRRPVSDERRWKWDGGLERRIARRRSRASGARRADQDPGQCPTPGAGLGRRLTNPN